MEDTRILTINYRTSTHSKSRLHEAPSHLKQRNTFPPLIFPPSSSRLLCDPRITSTLDQLQCKHAAIKKSLHPHLHLLTEQFSTRSFRAIIFPRLILSLPPPPPSPPRQFSTDETQIRISYSSSIRNSLKISSRKTILVQNDFSSPGFKRI